MAFGKYVEVRRLVFVVGFDGRVLICAEQSGWTKYGVCVDLGGPSDHVPPDDCGIARYCETCGKHYSLQWQYHGTCWLFPVAALFLPPLGRPARACNATINHIHRPVLLSLRVPGYTQLIRLPSCGPGGTALTPTQPNEVSSCSVLLSFSRLP